MKIHDVSVSVEEGMAVYPGDPGFALRRLALVEQGDEASVSLLCMGTHTGTHVDPPFHITEDGIKVDELPLDVLIGTALVVGSDGGEITRAYLGGLDLRDVQRVLFKTKRPGKSHLAVDAASYLLERGVRLVGVDGLSVDDMDAPGSPVHHKLLDGGAVIVECLDLSGVLPGLYEMFCLPLKVKGGDGAPARVVLRETA